MYEQRKKPKGSKRHKTTNKVNNSRRIEDYFLGHQANGLLQRQKKRRPPIALNYFQPNIATVQDSLPLAQNSTSALHTRGEKPGLGERALTQKQYKALRKV